MENNNLLNNISEKINKLQETFLESKIGKAVNLGIDTGIKAICPNLIEDQIIEVKDALLENGIKGGIGQIITSIKDFGKTTIGLVTGNFESIDQIETAVKNGGVLDTLSDVIDFALDTAENKGLIEKNIVKTIKKSKNTIIKDVDKNISDDLIKEQKTLEKVEGYIEEWKEFFKNKDFDNMDKIYKKIEKQIDKVLPIKKIINDSQIVENIHNLVKNNEGKFDLSENELALAEMLY